MANGSKLPWILASLLVSSAAACGDDSEAGGAPATGGAGGGGGETSGGGGAGGVTPLVVEWVDCGGFAECATIPMPLDRSDPGGPKVDFFVKRFLTTTPPSKGQLWLLQGGPGVAGSTLAGTVSSFRSLAPGYDIYLPDHRGVGESSALQCAGFDTPISGAAEPPSEADVSADAMACLDELLAQWGSIDGFSSIEAAADLGETIEATRLPDQAVHFWAVSYGTRWALRYLQQFPEQATGVVLDSLQSESMSFTDFGAQLESLAEPLLDRCGLDAFCSARLTADPQAFVATLMTKLDTGHCPTSAGLQTGDYRLLFAKTLALPRGLRDALPALLYRVDRCDAGDEDAILELREQFAISEADLTPFASGVLNAHVVLAELYDESPASFESLVAADEDRAFSNGDAGFYRGLYDVWPRYDASPYRGSYPTTSVPILMLQGELDPLTPSQHAVEVARALDGDSQTLVLLDNGAHGSMFNTTTGDGGDCAAELFAQFVADPTAALDVGCSSEVLAPDFSTNANAFLFGTTDLWD